MKTKLLALALLAGGSMFAETRFSIGVNLGGYNQGYYAPAPYAPYAPYAAVRPPCPGPDYSWVAGFWDQGYGRRAWHEGSWVRQSYYGGYNAQPRYENRSYEGYGRNGERRSYQNRSFQRNRDDRQGNGNGFGNAFRGR